MALLKFTREGYTWDKGTFAGTRFSRGQSRAELSTYEAETAKGTLVRIEQVTKDYPVWNVSIWMRGQYAGRRHNPAVGKQFIGEGAFKNAKAFAQAEADRLDAEVA